MYSKLHRPEKNALGISKNAGSCVKLAYYMNKEVGDGKEYFSHFQNHVSVAEVVERIDNNKRTLKNNQDKFYMLSYNPSQNEIAHLVRNLTGKSIKSLDELTPGEKESVFDEFRNYVRECMDIYAKKFNREKELSGEDLVYFGHIEEYRHYTKDDEAVKLGLKKRGDLKEGLQMHAHIIVSRMDVTQTIALAPTAKSRGNTNMLNGKEVKNGFDMQGWQVDCFELYSNKYRYIALQEERFYNTNPTYYRCKARIKNKVLNEVMEGMNEERKVLYGVNKVTTIIHPTKKSIHQFLRRKLKEILSENESVI